MKEKATTNHQRKTERELSKKLAESCKKNLPISKGGRVFRFSSPKNKT